MFTIKQVSKLMGVSEHTLRFWAKSDFFPFLERDKNNVRIFSESDLGWVKIVKCLRSVGTDNKSIKRYIDLCLDGDSTIPQRYEIILKTKEKALAQKAEIERQLELLDYKEQLYKDMIANKKEDKFNPAKKGLKQR